MWADLSYLQRAGPLIVLRQLIAQEAREIARIIARGTGKPMIDALLFEVARVVDTLDACVAFATDDPHARPLAARFAPPRLLDRSGAAILPAGPRTVVCVIAPLSSPFELALTPAVLALTAGSAVIVKACSSVPKLGVLIAYLLDEAFADFPGLVQVVHGSREMSAALMNCEGLDAIACGGTT